MHFLAFLLALGMQEPPSLEVAFEGHSAFSAGELRRLIEEDLKRYQADPRPAPLDDAVFRITQYYRSRGYAFAEVIAQSGGGRVSFRIMEGPLVHLGRIHFEGNTVFTGPELKELLDRSASGRLLPYSRKLLALQSETILAAYAVKGYIEAAVVIPEPRYEPGTARSHVTYKITEGRAFKIVSVGPAPPGLETRFQGFVGAPYDPETPAEAEAAASDFLRESGHPHPEVVATPDIDRVAATVAIKLTVKPGPTARLGDIEVDGNDRTRKAFIKSRASLEPGRIFRASEIREAERRILATGLFRQVRVTPGAVQEGVVPIEILVEENKPGEVSIRAGTGSLDGPRIGADIAYQNLFGTAALARVSGTASRNGGRADFELAFPWFLGTDFRPGISFYYESQELPSFDVSSNGFAPSLVYPFSDRHTVTVGWRQAEIRTSNVDPGVPPGDLLDFEYRALFLATSLDFRNSTLLPTRGVRLGGSVEWAPASFASDIEFFKVLARTDWYAGLPWDLVFAVSFQGGMIRPLAATDEIPISLRLFAGGANTVRGFKYGTIGDSVDGEPTGGELALSMQAEIRFPLWGEFHGAAFTDRGGVWLDPSDADINDTRWSVGAGLRYYTPAGALSADLAWNLAREEGEAPLVFHFSIGFPF
jgi:outer membrane protein assembly complex protein YaeT